MSNYPNQPGVTYSQSQGVPIGQSPPMYQQQTPVVVSTQPQVIIAGNCPTCQVGVSPLNKSHLFLWLTGWTFGWGFYMLWNLFGDLLLSNWINLLLHDETKKMLELRIHIWLGPNNGWLVPTPYSIDVKTFLTEIEWWLKWKRGEISILLLFLNQYLLFLACLDITLTNENNQYLEWMQNKNSFSGFFSLSCFFCGFQAIKLAVRISVVRKKHLELHRIVISSRACPLI